MSIAARFKSDVWLCSLDDAVKTTLKTFSEAHWDPFPGGAVVTVVADVCDDKNDLDFGATPLCSRFGREQRQLVI